ncbi:glycosyltransferase [Eubacterium sp. 1001713B170207_170306_E7]|uniref:glycosyltransferase n=1 Tax=Eubacterium sp. 1001713B170207_170306_E7 TaxID=2787097 RepID=UPI00189A09AD|nr:glycosyltransferase [Eubacterium sp. 1001713B170207_170306_E7]
MKILLVMDQFDHTNNGTTMSAVRFAETLRKHGHEVRIVSTGKKTADKYVVRSYRFPPVIKQIIQNQGMTLARPSKDVLTRAIAWADIVHFLMPFPLSVQGIKIAKKLSVPATAAFHVQPENITYTLKINKVEKINKALYQGFKKIFYNQFSHIHCPSHFIAEELRKNGYTAKLHVISNGVDPDFYYRKIDKIPLLRDKFLILMVGRLANEKRQELLIDAVGLSKYRDQIGLILAGQGPKKRFYEKAGKKLPNKVLIDFFDKKKLCDIIAMSDLYVHTADAESEAISCIEAFCSGLVPVISNSPKSATSQFALNGHCLFRAGDPYDLADKIDYFIEHPEEKGLLEKEYAEYGKQYNIEDCVCRMEEMFREAIDEYNPIPG